MFENIGGKTKSLAKIVCWLGIIGSVIGGFVYVYINNDGVLFLFIAGGGSLISWLSSFFVYGFGELIDSVQSLDKKIRSEIAIPKNNNDSQFKQSIRILGDLRNKGLITEEEYQIRLYKVIQESVNDEQ